MAEPKILERIQKLLRLAAPDSGTTDAERASAAIEAARLFAQHDISLDPPRPQEPGRVRRGVWVLTISIDRVGCTACSDLIAPRDIAWVRIVGEGENRAEWRHNYDPCNP